MSAMVVMSSRPGGDDRGAGKPDVA